MTNSLVYLIAGEASGDALGAGLMRSLRQICPSIRFAGIGGEAMEREGLHSLFPAHELSLMGFLEVVPHIPALFKRLLHVVDDVAGKQPGVVVTIDSPGFNFRLAKMLKGNPRTRDIKRVHYVAPSVWAYKPKRARKTAQLFDALLALLPFEPPYFEKEGLKTIFVGHPTLWENLLGDEAAFRRHHALLPDTKVLLLLPGSRAGEVTHHLPLFLETARTLPSFTPVILAGAQVKELIARMAPPGITVADFSEKKDAFATASLALSKSGTVTLELACARVPMVVAHRVNAFSAWLLRRMVLIPFVSLVNIAMKREIVPEFLQERCTRAFIAPALQYLASATAAQEQRQECATALAELRGNAAENPSTLAAKAVMEYL